MKSFSTAMKNIFATSLEVPKADCYTFTFLDGTTLRVTDFDVPVFIGGLYFRNDHIRCSGLRYKAGTGLEVDSQDMVVIAALTDTVRGVPFLQAVARKALDGCMVRRDRAYFDPAAWPPAPGAAAVALDSDLRFIGQVTKVKSLGRTTAQLSVTSPLNVLNQEYPHNYFGVACSHTWGDAGCGVNKQNYVTQGAVGSGATNSFIPCMLGGSGASAHAVLTGATGAAISQVVLTSDASANNSYTSAPSITISDPTGSGAVLQAIGTVSPAQEGAPSGSRFYLYGIMVVSGGSDYTAPQITISGGGGSGATAEAILGAGAASISSIVIDASGFNYSTKAVIVLTGGGGANAVYTPEVTNGQITGAIQIAAGSGYSSAPTVEIVDEASLAYIGGTIFFESGANAGVSMKVKAASDAGLTLAYPLDSAPASGDSFALWPGCDHTNGPGGCGAFHGNYDGTPFIPTATTAFLP